MTGNTLAETETSIKHGATKLSHASILEMRVKRGGLITQCQRHGDVNLASAVLCFIKINHGTSHGFSSPHLLQSIYINDSYRSFH